MRSLRSVFGQSLSLMDLHFISNAKLAKAEGKRLPSVVLTHLKHLQTGPVGLKICVVGLDKA